MSLCSQPFHIAEWWFLYDRSCDIDLYDMIWVILYIPLAVYMAYAFTSHLEPISWAIVFAVILGFSIVEWLMVRKDSSRSRITLTIMCLTLVSLLGGMILR